MGAEYQPDWNSGCTLSVCAFPNSPKFRVVEADYGTILSEETVAEKSCFEASTESKAFPRKRSQKKDRGSHSKLTASAVPKKKDSDPANGCFSPSKVKKWAIDDLNKTISWLDSQEKKPEPNETRKIAAEGILTCLQDAIDSLEQKQDVCKITEQWKFVPRVVEELAKLDGEEEHGSSMYKEDLYKKAVECKRVYEMEFDSLEDNSSMKKKKSKTGEQKRAAGYDSDETIEMTEEEIDLAYNNTKLHKH